MDKDKEEKFWDKQAKSFAGHDQPKLDNHKDFITTLKYLNPGDTVLNYGCATGVVANALADRAKEIHGIDISPRMIEMAREIAAERNINNVHYAPGTIFDDSLPKESFNMVLAFRVLHVLEDVPAVIRRVNEILKPGGVFISVTICLGEKKGLMGALILLASWLRILPLTVNRFKLPELEGLLAGGGFDVVEHEIMDDKLPHYCIVARKP